MDPASSRPPVRTDEIRLVELWTELKAGKLKVMRAASSETEHTLTLSYSVLGEEHAPVAELRLLEQTVLRGCQRVAMDLGVPASDVVSAAKTATAWIGVVDRPARLPPLVAFSVLATHRGSDVKVRREWREHVRLAMPRPEARLGSELSAYETAIVRLLVEGHGYSSIAEKHSVATRATANRIVKICKKLNVENRRDLIALAFALVDTPTAEV